MTDLKAEICKEKLVIIARGTPPDVLLKAAEALHPRGRAAAGNDV